ncbi:Cyclin-T1-2 [Cardamine amara subsp. amara]|uniref:Cyclin-T1-2 n=1 Tax=Cardamine amara subsp. amara TaxID=228776 RepID=A0ABD1BNZ9_CARAN
MDEVLPGNASGNESDASSVSSNHQDDEVVPWFFSREDIENNSPSRRDGIDLKKETRLRNSYCTFLNVLGKRLKFPQITIATAIVFCHRFFIRQSHAKNDRWTIATICMLLAGKVEETPRMLKDVIIVSYEIIHKKELDAAQRKEVYEQQKELVLIGEELVLSTLNFDLCVRHPYRPLVEAIKTCMVKDANPQLPQVAWTLLNNCQRSTLCLQFTPHHIAAGALFLAAEHLTMDFRSYGEVLCQELDITPYQLEDIRGQMLELYERKHSPTPEGSIVESRNGGDVVHRPVSRDLASADKCPSSDLEGGSSKVNLSMSNDHSVHAGSRPEGIGEKNSESEAGENHSVSIRIVETSDDVGDSQLKKDMQLHQEKVKAKPEKDNNSFDKDMKKRKLMDENDLTETELEDMELSDEDDKTMQKRKKGLLKAGDSHDKTSVEHSEILDAKHSGVSDELMADVSLMNDNDLKEMVIEDGEIVV